MTSVPQSPPLTPSGEASPESSHGHLGGTHKNIPYQNISSHAHGVGNQHPQQYVMPQMIPAGPSVHYPHLPMPNGQYFPPIPAPPATGLYPYPPGILPEQAYFYYHPSSWTVNSQMPVYHQHGFNSSPPGTPVLAPMPQYAYPVFPPQQEFFPHPHPNVNRVVSQPVPALDHRRTSWSSSDGSDGPMTPFTASVEPATTIIDGYQVPSAEMHRTKAVKQLENTVPILRAPVPTGIQGGYSHGYQKPVGQGLENPGQTTNVYIRGLPPDIDDDKLYEMTRQFGQVISHKAIMDNDHGTCKGYGFARYETIEEAEQCIHGLVCQKYEAGFARESFNARLKTLADPNSTNVYVSNLPRDMNEKVGSKLWWWGLLLKNVKDMQDIFSGYVVISNRILRDQNGQSRGVGFARFESRQICDEIIKNFHGLAVGVEKLPLQVRYADTSAQKRLKATTTKKRQFRANEYHTVFNGNYYGPHHQPHPHNRNRAGWGRHSSMMTATSHDGGVSLSHRESPPYGWEKPQDWVGIGDENRRSNWKPVSNTWRSGGAAVNSEPSVKLETVDENRDDAVIPRPVDGHNSPRQEYEDIVRPKSVNSLHKYLESNNRPSSVNSGSSAASDPGDCYGGREVY